MAELLTDEQRDELARVLGLEPNIVDAALTVTYHRTERIRRLTLRWAPAAIQRAHNYLTALRDDISTQRAEDPEDCRFFRLDLTRGLNGETSEAIDVAIDALRSAGAIEGSPSDV